MENNRASQQIPTYKELLIQFAANESHTVNRLSNVLTILDVSGGPYTLAINEGEESDIRAGITFKMPNGQQMRSIRFRETGGGSGNIRIALADGEIQDSRSSVSGNISIVNAASPNESIQVDMLAADLGLVALANTIVAALREDRQLRAPITTFAGSTYAEHSNTGGEVDVVSAAANTGGIIVRRAHIIADYDDPAYYAAGASQPFVGSDGAPPSGVEGASWAENILIPAGTSLRANFSGTSRKGFIRYEAL